MNDLLRSMWGSLKLTNTITHLKHTQTLSKQHKSDLSVHSPSSFETFFVCAEDVCCRLSYFCCTSPACNDSSSCCRSSIFLSSNSSFSASVPKHYINNCHCNFTPTNSPHDFLSKSIIDRFFCVRACISNGVYIKVSSSC